MPRRAVPIVLAALALVAGGCGKDDPPAARTATTLYLMASAPTPQDSTIAGAKLAVIQAGAVTGTYRITFVAQPIPRADTDAAFAFARRAVQDRQTSVFLTDDAATLTSVVPVLNEIGVFVLNTSAATVPCSASLYPQGPRTAGSVPASTPPPAAFRAAFAKTFGRPPGADAYRAYVTTRAVLAALAKVPKPLELGRLDALLRAAAPPVCPA